jgi:endonuclease/exonuclease/phosphatase family metal-dependent hydrolase
MKLSLNKILFKTLFIINAGFAIILLLSNLAPGVDPDKFWPIALLGILFPLVLVANIVFILFWLLASPKKAILSFAAVLLSFPNIMSTFGLNAKQEFIQAKDAGTIRLVTWNVALMNYTQLDTVTAIQNNALIFKKLKESNADIICLQEFFTAVIPGNHYNLMDSIAKTLNYPYLYFSRDNPKFDEQFFMGNIIFSRYKIIDTQKIIYPTPFVGSIIKTGIDVNGDTIDVFTTRFQSVKFKSQDYKDMNAIKNRTDTGFTGSKNIIHKLRDAYGQRKEQVLLAKSFMMKSKRPVLFSADINDVPVSFTYAALHKNMNDTWVKEGHGLGKTFQYLSPTLRIDHIFFDDHFVSRQVQRIFSKDETDHYGIVADLAIKKGQ